MFLELTLKNFPIHLFFALTVAFLFLAFVVDRESYVHYNLHHLKSFARKDDRGFCRHTEDIDFCGQVCICSRVNACMYHFFKGTIII